MQAKGFLACENPFEGVACGFVRQNSVRRFGEILSADSVKLEGLRSKGLHST